MEKIKVLVVDDSLFYRNILTELLSQIPNVEVVGTAENSQSALRSLESLQPDLVTLDFEMPVMDGLETLHRMKLRGSTAAVLMISNFTREGAKVTIKALELGAFDYITKPSDNTQEKNRQQLLSSLRHIIYSLKFKNKRLREIQKKGAVLEDEKPYLIPRPLPGPVEIVAIGVSTGGPQALKEVLSKLPKHFRVPLVIVQHMLPLFTSALADSLNQNCQISVVEGKQSQGLVPGTAYIAPGGKQMKVVSQNNTKMLEITDDPPENNCRPAADYLFRSVAEVSGNRAIGLIMTGMGMDGVAGLEIMRRRGARIIAQNIETCIVSSMPHEAIRRGLPDLIAPLASISSELINMVK